MSSRLTRFTRWSMIAADGLLIIALMVVVGRSLTPFEAERIGLLVATAIPVSWLAWLCR